MPKMTIDELEQRRRDRPLDEERRRGSWRGPRRRAAAGLIVTRAPGVSRSWPSVTTVSPAFTPLSMTTSSPSVQRDLDRPHFDGLVRLDDVDELALLARLHRALSARRSRAARPTAAASRRRTRRARAGDRCSGTCALTRIGVGRRIDGVVDERDRAVRRRPVGARRRRARPRARAPLRRPRSCGSSCAGTREAHVRGRRPG